MQLFTSQILAQINPYLKRVGIKKPPAGWTLLSEFGAIQDREAILFSSLEFESELIKPDMQWLELNSRNSERRRITLVILSCIFKIKVLLIDESVARALRTAFWGRFIRLWLPARELTRIAKQPCLARSNLTAS